MVHAPRVIDLGNIAGLHERNHELHAYCARCGRWTRLDLDRLIREGRGSARLPLRLVCRECGEVGQLQVRPPQPRHTTSRGWMVPPA